MKANVADKSVKRILTALAAFLFAILSLPVAAQSDPKPAAVNEVKPGAIRKNPIGMELVWIPPGAFTMGSGIADERPVRRVAIRDGFWMGRYEVTQGQWESVMGTTVSQLRDAGNKDWALHGVGAEYPIYYVSWEEAREFLRRLNDRNDGYVYSLPSEAQWEYAARAGTTGDRYGNVDDIAWHGANSENTARPVGGKKPNAFGLYDMLGNVWEWVEDIYNSNYDGLPTDGSANTTRGDSNRRVVRGGSWADYINESRSAVRVRARPAARGVSGGFRVVARPKIRPETVRKNSIGMELVWVPPGSFMMGSDYGIEAESPVRSVTIRDGFWMGRFEVTQSQWESVMETNPSFFKTCGRDCPVENVSWDDAKDFIGRLNAKNDGYVYSLPSEAQWEYAARAGTTGDRYGNLDDVAWYSENSGRSTRPAGGKAPNAFGLHDMLGNVFEWVEDIYSADYNGLASDGSPNTTRGDSQLGVVRGGSALNFSIATRSAARYKATRSVRTMDRGFRVVARQIK